MPTESFLSAAGAWAALIQKLTLPGQHFPGKHLSPLHAGNLPGLEAEACSCGLRRNALYWCWITSVSVERGA
jgi:hypothetical protein